MTILIKNINSIIEVLFPYLKRIFNKFARNYNEKDRIIVTLISKIFPWKNVKDITKENFKKIIDWKTEYELKDLNKQFEIILNHAIWSDKIDNNILKKHFNAIAWLKTFKEKRNKENLKKIYSKYTSGLKNKLARNPLFKWIWDSKTKALLNQINKNDFFLKSEKPIDETKKQVFLLKKSLKEKIATYKKINSAIETETKHWAALIREELDQLNKEFKTISQSKKSNKNSLSKWKRIKKELLDNIEKKRLKIVRNIIKEQKNKSEVQKALQSWLSTTQDKLDFLDKKLKNIWIFIKPEPKKRIIQYKWERIDQEAKKRIKST